jgi:hypothetical protein
VIRCCWPNRSSSEPWRHGTASERLASKCPVKYTGHVIPFAVAQFFRGDQVREADTGTPSPRIQLVSSTQSFAATTIVFHKVY